MLAAVVWAGAAAMRSRFGVAQVCLLAVVTFTIFGASVEAVRIFALGASAVAASVPLFIGWRRKATLPVGSPLVEQADAVSSPLLLIVILDTVVIVPILAAMVSDRS